MTTRRVDAKLTANLDERQWALEALSNLGDGVLIVDDEARVVYINDAAIRLAGPIQLGQDRARWSSDNGVFREDEVTLVPPDELPIVIAMRGEATSDVTLFIRNAAIADGVHVSTRAWPVRDGGGKVRGAICIFRDVAQRRRQQAQVLEGEWHKKAILDSIPDMAWLKTRDGRYLMVNQRFAQAAGKPGEEIVGLNDFDLWPHELATGYVADDAEVIKTKRTKRVEEPFVDASGSTSFIETIKACIFNDQGDVIGTTGIARDVTERHNAEQALRVTNDELERRVVLRSAELAKVQENLVRKERLVVLGQLAGGVAHQIRNPLAAIMNSTYVLKRHLSPGQHSNVDDAIRIIHDEVRHANVIITGLLDYARVRSPDRQPASIVEIVERVLVADWIPANVTVQRAIEEVPLLHIDTDQIQGALFNIVRNAVEAMPDGGTMRIEVRAAADQVLVAVSDTGPGISPHVSAHLFEPLHSTKPMGVGLGLVTARTFIEAHGGRIAVVEAARGARFEVRLPLA